MLKRLAFVSLAVPGLALVVSTGAVAGKTYSGRIVSFSPSSVSVLDKEVVTFTLDDNTSFTKGGRQSPGEQDPGLGASALAVGRYVAVHVRPDGNNLADWVQVATALQSDPVGSSPDCGCMTTSHGH